MVRYAYNSNLLATVHPLDKLSTCFLTKHNTKFKEVVSSHQVRAFFSLNVMEVSH